VTVTADVRACGISEIEKGKSGLILRPIISSLKAEAACHSETSAYAYETTRVKTHMTRVCTHPTFRRFTTHAVEEASLGKQRMEGSIAEFWLL